MSVLLVNYLQAVVSHCRDGDGARKSVWTCGVEWLGEEAGGHRVSCVRWTAATATAGGGSCGVDGLDAATTDNVCQQQVDILVRERGVKE